MYSQLLWDYVFGSSFETWSWWVTVTYKDGADWDKQGVVEITAWDPAGDQADYVQPDTVTRTVTPESLYLAALLYLGKNFTSDDVENLDADSADCIVQTAVFGEVVYS